MSDSRLFNFKCSHIVYWQFSTTQHHTETVTESPQKYNEMLVVFCFVFLNFASTVIFLTPTTTVTKSLYE